MEGHPKTHGVVEGIHGKTTRVFNTCVSVASGCVGTALFPDLCSPDSLGIHYRGGAVGGGCSGWG